MEPFLSLAAPVLVGVLVGVLSGMLGIGGGTVLVPIFRLAFGMSPVVATATSLFTIVPTSVSGAVAHLRGKTCLPALGIALGLGGACTSPAGAWLAANAPGWVVMLAAAAVIGYSSFTMFAKAWKMGKAAPATEAPEGQPAAPTFSRKQLLQGALIGAAAGLLSGFVGVGGGFFMVPLMVSFLGIDMRRTAGTSLLAVMILALPGAVMQGALGNIAWVAGILVVAGSIPGAVLGTRLQKHVPERALRFLFAGFLIVGAVLLVANEAAALF